MNPLLKLDYPDPDVIRVHDTYYMVSTTMYFMPGCEILESKDLVHWSHTTYVYDVLEETEGQKLENGKNAYGKGMWAASLRFHQGTFYVCFVANDTHKTYLYTAKEIEGPWEKHEIEGFYHDSSLLFDDDGRVYIAYGNTDIYITELKEDLSGPKENGYHKCVLTEQGEYCLGYEGTHFYKINGYYYLFLIHSPTKQFFRKEACFMTPSLDEPFIGGDVFDETIGFRGMGVAQGGIVDTPQGDWYGILFQDRGAVGRIPVLVPVSWEGHWPIMGNYGKLPHDWKKKDAEEYDSLELVGCDDFSKSYDTEHDRRNYGSFGLRSIWQFNHIPNMRGVHLHTDQKCLELTNMHVVSDLLEAQNTLTQRMRFPSCAASVVLDGTNMKDGDFAGICALQSHYGMLALTKCQNHYELVMGRRFLRENKLVVEEVERVKIDDCRIKLGVHVDFVIADQASFYFEVNGKWIQIGCDHKLFFTLDHFTGCRVGLFSYGSKQIGGSAIFSDFQYK